MAVLCSVALVAGCSSRNGTNGSARDAEVCEHVLCDGNGNWSPPVNLVDGGNMDEDAAVGATDAAMPVDDAGNSRDGSDEPREDASTPDSDIPDGLAPETLTGRWADVEQAVLRTCASFLDPDPGAVVDGAGTYRDSEPIEIDTHLNATFVYAAPDCQANCDAMNKVYAFVAFDGESLRGERLDEAAQRRYVLEITFSDANHFDGFITVEGLPGSCACGGDDCEPIVHGVRGTR